MTTITSAPAASTATAPARRPRPAAAPGGAAALRDERTRRIQLVMFTLGGVLMPFGILAICLGWYGSAHAHYEYDQNTYLISGGILGLGLTFLGGFLYFGAWLSRMSTDQRNSSAQLTDAMLALADVVAVRQRSNQPDAFTSVIEPLGGYETAPTSELVRAGSNLTVHLRSCALISARPDLHAYVPDGEPVTRCRVCKPEV
ncbi:hypothetical protein [Jatrophihabitans sp.]|uniref:hypothetical protein n=1 Tax=Jatrophihabitans sp. TaxID=1932789 RepID=UPI0030C6A443|nr:hypothetical protein [Jatrophihabitans sp.]